MAEIRKNIKKLKNSIKNASKGIAIKAKDKTKDAAAEISVNLIKLKNAIENTHESNKDFNDFLDKVSPLEEAFRATADDAKNLKNLIIKYINNCSKMNKLDKQIENLGSKDRPAGSYDSKKLEKMKDIFDKLAKSGNGTLESIKKTMQTITADTNTTQGVVSALIEYYEQNKEKFNNRIGTSK